MRKMISGSGFDTTATVLAALRAGRTFHQANLYLLGEPGDPMAAWMTDYDKPLSWPVWGTFQPGVVKRSKIKSKVGLEVATTDVEWSPANRTITALNATASPIQLAHQGFYNNWKIRIWRTIMPTPGDANTWGAYELFGGYVSGLIVDRQSIKISANSLLYVVNEQVPTNVIELTSTLSGFIGATPPVGLSVIPQFVIKAGSTPTALILDCTYPTPGQIFATAKFYQGFIAFNGGAGATLEGAWSVIRDNGLITQSGVDRNIVYLYNALPWAPTPTVDTCIISGQAPINRADGSYLGFPYVPNPQQALNNAGR